MDAASPITVRVLFFASAAELAGRAEAVLTLAPGTLVREALDGLCAAYPGLGEIRPSLAAAVNLAYVGPGHALRDGDELALIPPVSGG